MFRFPKNEWFYPNQDAHGADWRIEYHGTAGFTVHSRENTIVLDPFVTRPNLAETLMGPLIPNEALIQATFPKADAVLVGHAHHDHIMDAPSVCHHTGAQFIGSKDAAHVARAAGLPESQITVTPGRQDIHICGSTVRGIPSRHGRVYLGRVAFPGPIKTQPPWPARLRDFRHGDVLNWHVNTDGLTMVHIDSADFIDEELEGITADVVCLCAIGRKFRPNYVETVARKLKPKWIIPCHWDWFFTPYNAPAPLLPGVDLGGFVQEIREQGVEPILLPIGGEFPLSRSQLTE